MGAAEGRLERSIAVPVNGVQRKQLAKKGTIKATDAIRPTTPEPLPSPDGHDEDPNPNYDRVRRVITGR